MRGLRIGAFGRARVLGSERAALACVGVCFGFAAETTRFATAAALLAGAFAGRAGGRRAAATAVFFARGWRDASAGRLFRVLMILVKRRAAASATVQAVLA